MEHSPSPSPRPSSRLQSGANLTAKSVKTVAKPKPLAQPVSTKLTFSDRFSTFRVRLGAGRMNYLVKPGLYCVGEVDENSPVLVTANYKLTFDALRKELTGASAYILVLDTKGINVWCAAGKGTFGTAELVRRIQATSLHDVVSHRTLVLPQLSAVGVAGFEVTKKTGFRVVYGPVRAGDVPAFLQSGMQATRDMRTVRFTAWDRFVLTPVEFVQAIPYVSYVFAALFVLNVLGIGNYSLGDFAALTGAVVIGTVLVPLLLPILPFRAFSAKGAVLGLLGAAGYVALFGWPIHPQTLLKTISFVLLIPAVSSFTAMNFTGCSTYTSLSGVNREMKAAIPPILIASAVGVVLLLVGGILQPISFPTLQ